MEVLIAIFVMGIGMLSLLTLFPVGAMNMAQAMRDDRCAQAATNATALANAFNLRQDPNFAATLASGQPVYVDPYYALLGSGTLGGAIKRSQPSYVNTNADVSKFFSLLDDLGFGENGQAAFPPPEPPLTVSRAGAYTWAYLLRPVPSSNPPLVDMTVVVYGGRSTQNPEGETLASGAGGAGTNQIVVPGGKAFRRGTWILDVSAAQFYRVVNVIDLGGSLSLETQTPLLNAVNQFIIMDKVAEIFARGPGLTPAAAPSNGNLKPIAITIGGN